MQAVGEYLLSIIGVSIICAVFLRLLEGKGSAASVARMVTGILLMLTIMNPLSRLHLSDLLDLVPAISVDAEIAVEEGQQSAQSAMAECISTKLEAYILEKAEKLGADLLVEVELTQDAIPIPCLVRLQGNISPYAKAQLQRILWQDLGIEKEKQIWT